MRLLFLTLAAAVMLVPSNAEASLIDFGTYTQDTATGLNWLDLTPTQGLSVAAVTSELGVGGAWNGYRYATEAEVSTFFTNAGILDQTGAFVAANFGPVQTLIALLGTTGPGSQFYYTGGISSTPSTASGLVAPWIGVQTGTAGGNAQFGFTLAPSGRSDFGSWLVRDSNPAPVPEPGTLVLLGTGLAAAAVRRRMKKRG